MKERRKEKKTRFKIYGIFEIPFSKQSISCSLSFLLQNTQYANPFCLWEQSWKQYAKLTTHFLEWVKA